MAHKTLIDGTSYSIKTGKTLIDGTVFSINGGKTLIYGTAYGVSFGGGVATVTITGSNNYAHVVIDGVTYNFATELVVPVGTVITCVTKNSNYGGSIEYNFESVATGNGAQYEFVVTSNTTIKFGTKDPSGYGYALYGTITIADENAPPVATITITKTGSGQPNAGPYVSVNGTSYTTAGTVSVPIGTVVKCLAPWGKAYNSSTYYGGTITMNGEVIAERGSTSPTVYEFVLTNDIDIALTLQMYQTSQTGGIGYAGNIAITGSVAVNKILTNIAITTPPSKTTYAPGDNFDKTGMVVTATYDDGSTEVISSYTISNGSKMPAGQTSVTISYTYNGATKTAVQYIEVIKVFVVLNTDGSMVVYKRGTIPSSGEVYNDKTVSTVYDWAESSSSTPWKGNKDVVSVAFADKITPNTCSEWFYNCNNLVEVSVENLDISKVTDTSKMFSYCYKLATILGLDKLDTSNIINMSGMFQSCNSLTSLNLSNWVISNVTNMSSMFTYCNSLTSLDLSDWNTSKVTSMDGMFTYCSSLTSLDLSNWNTSNVTNMSGMFQSCNSLTSLNLSNFNTSNVTSMSSMFAYCNSLTSLDLSDWNTSKVTSMSSMFSDCDTMIILDVSSFDTQKVTRMGGMFQSCDKLTTIYASDMFSTDAVIADTAMFEASYELVGGAGTIYNSSKTGSTYARIDGGEASPGYFTAK